MTRFLPFVRPTPHSTPWSTSSLTTSHHRPEASHRTYCVYCTYVQFGVIKEVDDFKGNVNRFVLKFLLRSFQTLHQCRYVMSSTAPTNQEQDNVWESRVGLTCDSDFGLHRQVYVAINLTCTSVRSSSKDSVDALVKFRIPQGMFIDTFELQVRTSTFSDNKPMLLSCLTISIGSPLVRFGRVYPYILERRGLRISARTKRYEFYLCLAGVHWYTCIPAPPCCTFTASARR